MMSKYVRKDIEKACRGATCVMGHCQKPIAPLGDSNCKRYPNSLCYDAQYDSGR
jgi:hypothetical protein